MSKIESQEDVYCWIVREGDTAQMYYDECVTKYVGDGDPQPIHEAHMLEGACVLCGAELTHLMNIIEMEKDESTSTDGGKWNSEIDENDETN